MAPAPSNGRNRASFRLVSNMPLSAVPLLWVFDRPLGAAADSRGGAGGLPGPFLRGYASVKGDGAGRGREAGAHQYDVASGEIVSGRPLRAPGGAWQGRPTGMTDRRAACGATARRVAA